MKTTALYGFSPELGPFKNLTPTEQVALLQSWGNTAIFGGHEDPDFIDAAHAAGMNVYAEIGLFVHKNWWKEIPASRPIAQDGRALEPEEWYSGVNPSTPAVRHKLLQRLARLLTDHALDGVWLDFIRWPCHWESPAPILPRTSFDAPTLSRFRHDTGLDIPVDSPTQAAQMLLTRYESDWTTWRCEQITSWVAEARAVVTRIRPEAVLGLFGVPWRLSDFDGAILNVIGQDYGALGSHVDVFSPMVYHAMCGRPVEWIGQVTDEIHARSGKPVWPIIQSVDEPAPLPAAEYGAALDVALQHPASEGVLVFTLQGALGASKLAVTRSKFA